MSVSLPAPVRAGVAAVLGRSGEPAEIVSANRVGGGCISPSARIALDGGERAFLKWGAGTDMFAEEARSLQALADSDTVRVPAVLGVAVPDDDVSWLLLEWLEPGPATRESWAGLGRGLAALHRVRADLYGWPSDNFIGSLPQSNGHLPDWPSFWGERRLTSQLRRAYDGGYFEAEDRRRFDALLDSLEDVLESAATTDGPSLLHGDLWSGNAHALEDGTAALIDPACYHGHREADLAMTELFGGFSAAFYRAYEEAWPLVPGYRERRRAIYQLYYLLVHVNLFGRGYVGRTLDTLATAEARAR